MHHEIPADKDPMFDGWPETEKNQLLERESELTVKYGLSNFRDSLSVSTWLDNLHVLDGLDQLPGEYLPRHTGIEPRRVLDIGSRVFAYAGALHYFFLQRDGQSPCLTGIELDGYRRFSDLTTRADHARFHLKPYENSRYLVMDLLDLEEGFDTITWFFPFLTPTPILAWGLPLSHLKPQVLLAHARELLVDRGRLLVVNQSLEEGRIQDQLFADLNWPVLKPEHWSPSFPRENREWLARIACNMEV